MGIRRAIVLAAAVAALGCATTPTEHHSTTPTAAAPAVTLTVRPYAIGLGDRLRFEAPSVPELHEREATVRDDGTIDLPLTGAAFVAGRTPAQLSSELYERLSRYYLAPAVRVSVLFHLSQSWYAEAGDVRVTRPYTGDDEPSDALHVLRVGGFAPVGVYRPDEAGRLHLIELGKEPLEAGDVVRIGTGRVAQAEK